MNTPVVLLERLSSLPQGQPFQAVAPITLEDAAEIANLRHAAALYWTPLNGGIAFLSIEPPKIMTREQYTEEWTVAEILKREG